MKPTIRRARASDIEHILTIWDQTRQVHEASHDKGPVISDMARLHNRTHSFFTAHLKRIVRGHKTFGLLVAEQGGKVVGFIKWARTTRWRGFALTKIIEIHDLGVLSGFRGKGIGTTLLRETASLGKQEGYDIISLRVSPKNKKAISLYEREGFAVFRVDMGKHLH